MTVFKDEILEEIHRYREEYAKSFNYDLKAMSEDIRKKQIASGHEFVKLPIKRKAKNLLNLTIS